MTPNERPDSCAQEGVWVRQTSNPPPGLSRSHEVQPEMDAGQTNCSDRIQLRAHRNGSSACPLGQYARSSLDCFDDAG